MALDDDLGSGDDSISVETAGGNTLTIGSEARRELNLRLATAEMIKENQYTCGACAAYPCFRGVFEDSEAGLCFQLVRQCRQECRNYKYPGYPAQGGKCGLDDKEVVYCQECHVPAMKK